MSLLASLAACVTTSVDGRTAVRNVWIKLGAQGWAGDTNSTDLPNEAIEAHAHDYHPMPADTDIKMVCLAGTWHDRGLSQDCTAFLLEAVTDTLAFLETRTRGYDLKSKLMEEPLRSAETASHVETIEALKALATNRDFPIDMRSLSHRLLDTPVYTTIDVTEVTNGFDKYRRYVSYLAAAFSTRDMVEQVVDKLKEKHHPRTLLEACVHIPSIRWVNVVEPNLPITFGGVTRKGIMPAYVPNVAGDHDFHKVSLTPSVALEVVVKPQEEGDGLQSFYRGQCHVVLKDSVFQPYNPLRHAAELMSIARSCSMRGDITRGTPGVAFIMSDGGPDHNVSFYTVIAAWLALFLDLEMDVLTISRTTPI
eukprot:jgi/Tetstr1/421209/TSEL_001114.t1